MSGIVGTRHPIKWSDGNKILATGTATSATDVYRLISFLNQNKENTAMKLTQHFHFYGHGVKVFYAPVYSSWGGSGGGRKRRCFRCRQPGNVARHCPDESRLSLPPPPPLPPLPPSPLPKPQIKEKTDDTTMATVKEEMATVTEGVAAAVSNVIT